MGTLEPRTIQIRSHTGYHFIFVRQRSCFQRILIKSRYQLPSRIPYGRVYLCESLRAETRLSRPPALCLENTLRAWLQPGLWGICFGFVFTFCSRLYLRRTSGLPIDACFQNVLDRNPVGSRTFHRDAGAAFLNEPLSQCLKCRYSRCERPCLYFSVLIGWTRNNSYRYLSFADVDAGASLTYRWDLTLRFAPFA